MQNCLRSVIPSGVSCLRRFIVYRPTGQTTSQISFAASLGVNNVNSFLRVDLLAVGEGIGVAEPTLVCRINLHRIVMKRFLLSTPETHFVTTALERQTKLLFSLLILSEVLFVLGHLIKLLDYIALCLQVKHRVSLLVNSVTGFKIVGPLPSLVDVLGSGFVVEALDVRLMDRGVFLRLHVGDCH